MKRSVPGKRALRFQRFIGGNVGIHNEAETSRDVVPASGAAVGSGKKVINSLLESLDYSMLIVSVIYRSLQYAIYVLTSLIVYLLFTCYTD
jgi:hypothetical protein